MIRHVVALDQKRGIAKRGVQPWKLPSDEQNFSALTKTNGAVILMGRTTFEVIGHPLADRQNFVASRAKDYKPLDAAVIHDIDAFLQNHADVWVIGGAQIYAATLQLADELYITEIDADFQCDVFYPNYTEQFELTHEGPVQQENGLTFRFNRYARRSVA
jgi:dihydrofolate reductase